MDADFTKIRRISPAFAGVLVDWSMGSREITATLIDLIVQGCLSVEGKTVSIGKNANMKKFEREFISKIFGSNKFLSFEELSKKAFGREFSELMKIISSGMSEEGLIAEGLEKKMANAVKEAIKESFAPEARVNIPNSEKVRVMPSWFYPVSWVVSIILLPLGLLLAFQENLLLGIAGKLVTAFSLFALFTLIFIRSVSRKVSEKFGGYDLFLSEKGKEQKAESEKLREFMRKFPLLEDRLANELVGHAIAFGMGKEWMKKIGKTKAFVNMAFEAITPKSEAAMRFIDFNKYMNEFKEAPE